MSDGSVLATQMKDAPWNSLAQAGPFRVKRLFDDWEAPKMNLGLFYCLRAGIFGALCLAVFSFCNVSASAREVNPASQPASSAASGGRMARYVGTYNTRQFLAEAAVSRPLAAGMRDAGLRRLRANLQVTGPIEQVGAMIVLRGQAPHMGGEEEAIVATDVSGELVEAAILSGGKISVYGSSGRPTPDSVVMRWAQERSESRTIEFYRP